MTGVGAATAAGLPTCRADPPFKAAPCATMPRSLPRGNFDAGQEFRLPTPKRVGIGVRINEFKPPEVESWHKAANERGQSFTRGHRYFDHYASMQRKAELLVPKLPTHNRAEDLDRLWEQRIHEEAHRDATLSLIDFNERRRLERLQETKSMLQRPREARLINQTLQASCSLPELARSKPFGDRTEALQLLNRRVDVNHAKRKRAKLGSLHQDQMLDAVRHRLQRAEAVADEIDVFEATHLHPSERQALYNTADWSVRSTNTLKPIAEGSDESQEGMATSFRTTVDWRDSSTTGTVRFQFAQ